MPAVAAALGLAALAGVLAFVFLRGSEDALAEAGCRVEAFPAQQREHIQEPKENFEYNSFPPTSGPHHEQPVPFRAYDEPIEQFRLVHNLEHGGIVVQYGSRVLRAEVDELLEWYRDDPNGIVVAPLPRLGDRIAFAGWTLDEDEAAANPDANGQGHLATCGAFDADAGDAFVDRYGFQGPERLAREDLAP